MNWSSFHFFPPTPHRISSLSFFFLFSVSAKKKEWENFPQTYQAQDRDLSLHPLSDSLYAIACNRDDTSETFFKKNCYTDSFCTLSLFEVFSLLFFCVMLNCCFFRVLFMAVFVNVYLCFLVEERWDGVNVVGSFDEIKWGY